jgi:hypothetical protein
MHSRSDAGALQESAITAASRETAFGKEDDGIGALALATSVPVNDRRCFIFLSSLAPIHERILARRSIWNINTKKRIKEMLLDLDCIFLSAYNYYGYVSK